MKTILNLQEIEEAVCAYLNIPLTHEAAVSIDKCTKKGVITVQATVEHDTPKVNNSLINDPALIQKPVLFSEDSEETSDTAFNSTL